MRATLWVLFFTFLQRIWSVELNGTEALLGDIEFIYQVPQVPRAQIKGAVFIARGCGGTVRHSWPKSARCPECDGKSLTQSLVRLSLEHNYAVFASNAHNKTMKCWEDHDLPRLVTLFHHFYRNIYQDQAYKTPLHLLGICNGGVMLGIFLQNQSFINGLKPIRVASLALTVAAVRLNSSYTKSNKFTIPTFFLPMEKDGGIYWNIRKSLHLFETAKLVVAKPVPMTREFIYNTSMGAFTWKESEELYNVLKKHQVIDESDYVRQDPISFNYEWRQIIKKYAPAIHRKDGEKYENSVLGQLLRSAYGHHGLAVHKYPEIFDFFDYYSS